MKTQPEIEELISAAKRMEADKRRQQELMDMIDRMETKEAAPAKRRKMWAWGGIAASLLLVAGIGVRMLSRTGNEPVVTADAGEIGGVALDADLQQRDDSTTGITIAPDKKGKRKKRYETPAASETKEEGLLAENVMQDPMAERPLAAMQNEGEATSGPATQNMQPASDETNEMLAVSKKRVYERRSNRLVGGKKSVNRTTQPREEKFSFIACNSTSTEIEVQSFKF